MVCLRLILLCYRITCLWFCNKKGALFVPDPVYTCGWSQAKTNTSLILTRASNPPPAATRRPGRLWTQPSVKSQVYLKHCEILLRLCVTMYLTCVPRQLFFFRCGPEMPKGWTPPVRTSCSDRNKKVRNEWGHVKRTSVWMGGVPPAKFGTVTSIKVITTTVTYWILKNNS